MKQQLKVKVYRNALRTVERCDEHGVNHMCFGGRASSHLSHVVLTALLLLAVVGGGDASGQDHLEVPAKLGWVTPKRFKEMVPHPRLFVSQAQIDRMVKGRGEDFAEDYEKVEAAAKAGLDDTENPLEELSIWKRGIRIQGRLFVVIDDKGVLVLDRVIGRAGNPVEARAYTMKEATFGENDVLLKGEFETARMTFAADRPAVLRRASGLVIQGSDPIPVMMRWQTLGRERDVTLASLLTRGDDKVNLSVDSGDDHIVIDISGNGWERKIKLTSRLLEAM